MTAEAQANKTLIVDILRAYGQGDWRPLLAALHIDVTWQSHARPPHYRFGGPRRGHIAVTEALAMIASEYAIQRYEVKHVVAEGDTVWALSEGLYQHHATNKPVTFLIATCWVLQAGKIVDYNSFFDTAAVLVQQGRLAAE